MANIINAITAGSGGLSTTADASGNLNIQSGGSTVLALTSSGVTVTGTLSATTISGAGNPAGTIIQFAGSSAPTGYLLCPTSATTVSRTTYADLFTAIGTTWGSGNGSTTFNIPAFTADFAMVQASSNVGTTTTGSVIAHTHTIAVASSNNGGNFAASNNTSGGYTATTNSTGGTNNLAAGARVLFCIKY